MTDGVARSEPWGHILKASHYKELLLGQNLEKRLKQTGNDSLVVCLGNFLMYLLPGQMSITCTFQSHG